MKNPRFLTAAGSAVAASIAIGAFLFVSSNQTIVQASTILHSFRQSLLNGFELEIENIGDDGVWVDGKIVVLFEPGRPREPEALFAELGVRFDETNEDLAGAELKVALGVSEDSQWAFLQAIELPEKLREEQPMAWAVLNLASVGVVLELDGVLDDVRSGLKETFAAFHEAHEDLGAGAGLKHGKVAISIDGDKTIQTGDGQEISERQLAQLARDFLYGRAGAEQLATLVSLLESSAGKVSIEEIDDGLHRLSVSDFSQAHGDADADEQEMLSKMVLEIVYREGDGVQSATINNVGPTAGTVRISMVDQHIDRTLFDKQQFIGPGVIVWDLSNLPMIKDMIEAHHK